MSSWEPPITYKKTLESNKFSDHSVARGSFVAQNDISWKHSKSSVMLKEILPLTFNFPIPYFIPSGWISNNYQVFTETAHRTHWQKSGDLNFVGLTKHHRYRVIIIMHWFELYISLLMDNSPSSNPQKTVLHLWNLEQWKNSLCPKLSTIFTSSSNTTFRDIIVQHHLFKLGPSYLNLSVSS